MIFGLESRLDIVHTCSCEEQGLKSKVMEKCSVGLGMSKGVDVPSNSWNDSKFLAEPLMTLNKVLNDVLKVLIGLVCVHPSAHNDLKSTLFH